MNQFERIKDRIDNYKVMRQKGSAESIYDDIYTCREQKKLSAEEYELLLFMMDEVV